MILAVFQYFLSMVIFLNVLTRLDATQAAVSNYLIPFLEWFSRRLSLGEHLTPYMLAGGALVLVVRCLLRLMKRCRAVRLWNR